MAEIMMLYMVNIGLNDIALLGKGLWNGDTAFWMTGLIVVRFYTCYRIEQVEM